MTARAEALTKLYLAQEGFDHHGAEGGGSRCNRGGHGSVCDGLGVADKRQLASRVESVPAEPQDHDAQHKQGAVVAWHVHHLQQQQCG